MEERRRPAFQILPQILLLEVKSQGDGLEEQECGWPAGTPKPVSQTFAITHTLSLSLHLFLFLLLAPFCKYDSFLSAKCLSSSAKTWHLQRVTCYSLSDQRGPDLISSLVPILKIPGKGLTG